MKLRLERYKSNDVATLGKLFVDDAFECFTVEDAFHEVKIYSKTRIPSGTYDIKLQTHGEMTGKYVKRFPTIHQGMLWLQDVPNFTTIYIHIGNTDEDTCGCILICSEVDENNLTGSKSTQAYLKLYPKVVAALLHEAVSIEILDLDRAVKPV